MEQGNFEVLEDQREDKGKLEKHQNKKKPSDEVHISKKALVAGAIVCILFLAGLLGWQLNAHIMILKLAVPAEARVTVVDSTTQKPLDGATVRIKDSLAKTDKSGQATISGLYMGDYHLAVTMSKYKNSERDIRLKRGENTVDVALEINIEKTSISGAVTDYISEAPVEGAEVAIGENKARTDQDGKYTLENVAVEEMEVTVNKKDYDQKTSKVLIEKKKPFDFTLMPTGKVVFVSTRDRGKQGIYVSDYSGSDIKQLVKRVDDTEDYDISISPDRSKIIFLSTREKRKTEGNSFYDPSLYMIDSNGENLVKLSSEYGLYNKGWSSNGKYIAWASRPAAENYTSSVHIYSLQSKKEEKISTSGTADQFYFNHKGVGIAWSQYAVNGEPSAEVGVFYRDLVKAENKRVSEKGGVSGFSDDDKQIKYAYYDNSTRKTQYYLYGIADAVVTTTTADPYTNSIKVMSPDGKKYAYQSTRDGKSDIYISDIDGKNEQRLTTTGTVSGNPDWDLSGRYILFNSIKTAETAKYIVGLTGKEAKKITDIHIDSGYGR